MYKCVCIRNSYKSSSSNIEPMPEAPSQDLALSYTWLVLDSIKKMRDAQAAGERDKYVIHFEFILQLLIPHIDVKLRTTINKDRETLQKEITKIRKENTNEQSRKSLILDLREDFANSHRGYIFAALSRVGIIRVSEDGIIDFNSTDMATLQAIIRNSGAGLDKAIEGAVK
jgi:hypothetical protein